MGKKNGEKRSLILLVSTPRIKRELAVSGGNPTRLIRRSILETQEVGIRGRLMCRCLQQLTHKEHLCEPTAVVAQRRNKPGAGQSRRRTSFVERLNTRRFSKLLLFFRAKMAKTRAVEWEVECQGEITKGYTATPHHKKERNGTLRRALPTDYQSPYRRFAFI